MKIERVANSQERGFYLLPQAADKDRSGYWLQFNWLLWNIQIGANWPNPEPVDRVVYSLRKFAPRKRN